LRQKISTAPAMLAAFCGSQNNPLENRTVNSSPQPYSVQKRQHLKNPSGIPGRI
jgi:hypothetical protein